MRLDWEDALHHIMVRGIDGKGIFLDELDKSDLIARFDELVPEMDVNIYAWVIMPNHFHLLVRTGNEPIYRFMHRLLTGYAVSYNLRNERKGYVFQGRFKSILVQEEMYFLNLMKYIHLNPLKAGLVTDFQELQEYRWSGHGSIIGVRKYLWHNRLYALSKFGTNIFDSKSRYVKYVSEEISNKTMDELHSGTYLLGKQGICDLAQESHCDNWRGCFRVLGNKEFAVSTMNRLKQMGNRIVRDREETHKKIAELFTWVTDNMGFSTQMILGNTRNPELSDSRALIAWVLSDRLGLSQSDCSGVLKMSRSGIRKAITKGKRVFADSRVIKDNDLW